MAKQASYNMRNPGVRRIFQEMRELQLNPSNMFTASCSEEDIFEWHFTVRGPPDSDFEGGVYHGRINLPSDYPFKPPSIVMLTPNGRFELGTKICLSISNHHPELWQPWSIRIMLNALINFFPTKSEGAIGGIEHPSDYRKSLAAKSPHWKCDKCGMTNAELLPPVPEGEAAESPSLPEGVTMYEENKADPGSPGTVTRSEDVRSGAAAPPSPPAVSLEPVAAAPQQPAVAAAPAPPLPVTESVVPESKVDNTVTGASQASQPAGGAFVIPGYSSAEDDGPNEPEALHRAPHRVANGPEARRRASSTGSFAQQRGADSLDYATWAVFAMILALATRKVLVMNGLM